MRAIALLLLLTVGCASMTTADKVYWAGTAVDLGTTGYGLETCPNLKELNPLMTLGGDDAAQVVASGFVIKYLTWRVLKRIDRKQKQSGRGRKALFAVGGVQVGMAAYNMTEIRGCSQ